MPRFWIETLGCPKNQVDSEKLAGRLRADGFHPAGRPGEADLVVVNTCAFIEPAREESIEAVLAMADARGPGSRLVVTGCMAERYSDELAAALPEVDQVAPFGVAFADHAGAGATVPVALRRVPSFDLLNLPRPPAAAPWAYVKIAEGCDRNCGFCAIPSFRGRQRSRSMSAVLEEVGSLGSSEIVLVAQDLVSWGRDASARTGPQRDAQDVGLTELVRAVAGLARRVRLLYLYPSGLTDGLVDAICATEVPYFDLSLQHVSASLLRRMRRWGNGRRFVERVERIRRLEPRAVFRSSFIVGYPGETEEDHDELLRFLEDAQLDWAGFFAFSPEEGTLAATLDGVVPPSLVAERLAEVGSLQDRITAAKRASLVGRDVEVMIDQPGAARSYREAPEIDGIVEVPRNLPAGAFVDVHVTESRGPDLVAACPPAA